ncbi:MAG TPA: STM3941 family protein [Rhodocyclaceae bacterium]|nr:STM3941 family protein [Rhodocyclaceae bacterium]
MKKLLFCLGVPLLLAFWHVNAHAGLKFGTVERFRFIANTTLEGPSGEKLYLARKITERHFLLPYAITDDGYVLGISGESRQYFPMPEGVKLEAIQNAGYLPKPLPAFELDTFDLVFGHLLWVGLAALMLYGTYLYLGSRFRPKSAGAEPEYEERPPTPQAKSTRYSDTVFTLPMRLYPARVKALGLLVGSVLFVLGGLFLLDENPVIGYSGIAFFGLCALVFLVQLALPNSSYLELTEDSFTYASLFKKTTVPWRDVAAFRVATISRNKMVGWTVSSTYDGPRTGLAISNALTGTHGALPDTFGMKAEDLAELMNEFKYRHGG